MYLFNRQNGGNCDIERAVSVEEMARSQQEDNGPVNRQSTKDNIRTSNPDIKRWESNTTIDSFCSVKELEENDEEKKNEGRASMRSNDGRASTKSNEGRASLKLNESRTPTKLNEANLAKLAPFMLPRKQSWGSSQWKGVRWKPMDPVEAAGTLWLNKATRRYSTAQFRALQKRLRLPEMRSSSEPERATPPLDEVSTARSSPSLQSVEASEPNVIYNHVDPTAISLPNIAVKPRSDK